MHSRCSLPREATLQPLPCVALLRVRISCELDDVPDLLGTVAEFGACYTGTETVVADGDGVVLELIGEVILALGHGADENADALVGVQVLDVLAHLDDRGVETKRDLAAVRRKMIGDGVLDDLEELLLRRGGPDGQTVQQLHHQTGETLEGTRDAHARADFDEDTLGCVDVDLEPSSLVDRRVEKGKQALGCS